MKEATLYESSLEARTRYGIQIADAVADVIGPKSKVCAASVFEGSSAWACLFKSLGYSVLAVLLMLLAWVPSIPCKIKRLTLVLSVNWRSVTDSVKMP